MSKRVKIAVIREATLNAKPTDTHYLAEGGLKISRRDARALKGTTLYYEVLVDLGEVKGFDFIPGRDVPVYQTDSEPVLALQPQSLQLIDERENLVAITVKHVTHSHTIDSTLIPQNAAVEPIASVSRVELPMAPAEPIASIVPPEAPAKRKPGRPKKVVAEAPAAPTAPEPEVKEEIPTAPAAIADFEVEEVGKQDDESTFLIDPEGVAPTPAPQAKPEFSFDVDEDEAPPPPVRNSAPQNLGFEVEDDEDATVPVSAPVSVETDEPEVAVKSNADDYSDVEPGLFDE